MLTTGKERSSNGSTSTEKESNNEIRINAGAGRDSWKSGRSVDKKENIPMIDTRPN